jgi:hypothetical protein
VTKQVLESAAEMSSALGIASAVRVGQTAAGINRNDRRSSKRPLTPVEGRPPERARGGQQAAGVDWQKRGDPNDGLAPQ